MKQKPGSKVLIIEDCREGSPATGLVGVYEGDFPRGACVMFIDFSHEFDYTRFVNGKVCYANNHPHLPGRSLVAHVPFWTVDGRYEHPLGEGYPTRPDNTKPLWFPSDNPRIRLPDGSIIWGDECWWGDAETAPPTLEEAQESLGQHKDMLRGMASAFQESEDAPQDGVPQRHTP